MQTLPEWSTWIGGTVAHYKDRIRYWRVWNEGNAGFNDGHHTTGRLRQTRHRDLYRREEGRPAGAGRTHGRQL